MTTANRFGNRLVAWCPSCLTWLEDWNPDHKQHCPGCENQDGSAAVLVKRRGWVCPDADCLCIYFNLKEWEEHEHGDCY